MASCSPKPAPLTPGGPPAIFTVTQTSSEVPALRAHPHSLAVIRIQNAADTAQGGYGIVIFQQSGNVLSGLYAFGDAPPTPAQIENVTAIAAKASARLPAA